jgi:hypothetical protein
VEKISSDTETLAKEYGYIPYMVERCLEMIGYDETMQLPETFDNYKYRSAILCNSLRIDCEIMIEKLISLGSEIEKITWCNLGFTVNR